MATILVVDDRATNREFLVTLLGYRKHRVFEAEDGRSGLEIARSEKLDLIIVDIVMPEMDGYDFVRAVRSVPAIASTPIIFYTASYLESEARSLAERCGVRFIITKPAEPEEILAKVDAVLQTPAAPVPLLNPEFDREHLKVVTSKLSEKVDELEALNTDLEKRVAARTAELEEANKRLTDLNRRKDEMVAIVSHDLRSPLTGVLLVTTLLRNKKAEASPEYRLERVAMIENATRRMVEMVNDLLDVSRIGAQEMTLELQPIRASDVIRTSLEPLEITANAKQVSVSLEVAPDEAMVRGDRLKLSQVFNNLLGNALKFTRVGGKISVKIESTPEEVGIHVCDTGVGIPANELPLIFDTFRQASSRATAGEAGAGLGLAIVKQIVELHKGRVEVESEVGHGSTFTVHLPAIGPMEEKA
jgi:signal transduction histidine kinase